MPTMEVRPMREGEPFTLNASERALFDCIATEQVNIAGTEIEYFQLALDTLQNTPNGQPQTIRDPLYDEPFERRYLGPYKLKAYVSYPDISPLLAIEGFSSSIDATAFIPRASIEAAGMPAPTESDILGFWLDSYYHNQAGGGTAGFPVAGSRFYFSVIDVKEEAQLFDTYSFLGFTLTLRRTTQQTPERKIVNAL
jgi:hypothetical protein